MEINIERMMNDFDNIIQYNRTPQKGYTRFSYSAEDKQARDYLFSEMERLGLSIKVDAIGNIRAKYGEIEAPSIMVGSHIDTVENGGKFDGLTGVLAGLEVIRVLKEEEIELSHPIELIIFAEEEGSNFGIPMLGSKVLTGKYNLKELKSVVKESGESVYEVAEKFGLSINNLEKDILKSSEADSMIELHIEQGAVLETQNKSIGIVQAIAGMKSYKVILEGDSNHAGTTPMNLRRDPMAGAAAVISYIQKAAKELSLPSTVATVGKIVCQPNMHNVIPQRVEFFVDIRDVETKGIDIVANKLIRKVKVSIEQSLESRIELIGESNCVQLSSRIVNAIEGNAKKYNQQYMKINSGAVHDAAMLTNCTDVGMIFIPSIGGKSHSPKEHTSKRDIKAGCSLLLNVVKSLATQKIKDRRSVKT